MELEVELAIDVCTLELADADKTEEQGAISVIVVVTVMK